MNQAVKSVLLLDNYDSFTYNLYDYLLQCGVNCRVIRNDALDLEGFKKLSFDLLVISPGPSTPEDAGLLMDLVHWFHDKVPILGICLGHQAIGCFFGATLCQANMPVHGKATLIHTSPHPVFAGLPARFNVMRYHSLILRDLEQTPLQVIASTKEKEIMAIAHPDLPIVGFQFHPESILTEFGLQLIKNWLFDQGAINRSMLPEV